MLNKTTGQRLAPRRLLANPGQLFGRQNCISNAWLFHPVSNAHRDGSTFTPTLCPMVNETGNRNRILEMCKFRFRLVHWIDPRSIEHSYACYFSVCQSVCVSVNRSVVERLRPQFFTDFHESLHAAQKCGRFVAYCL